eukprot:tig00021518_g22026.t1
MNSKRGLQALLDAADRDCDCGAIRELEASGAASASLDAQHVHPPAHGHMPARAPAAGGAGAGAAASNPARQRWPPPQRPASASLLRVSDAAAYLDLVREEAPEAYEPFLALMRDFRAGRLGTEEVVVGAVRLFAGRGELIDGLGYFLPPNFDLRVDPEGRITALGPEGPLAGMEEVCLLHARALRARAPAPPQEPPP